MRRKDPHTPHARIAALAGRQHGHVHWDQLIAAGFSRTQIDRLVRNGWLIRVFAKVYAVGHVQTTPLARASAAVLACGPGALLSHASAAALWAWRSQWPATPEVTTAKDRRPRGITVHRSTTLARPDRTRQRAIAVTSPARTLFDMAPRLTDARLATAFNDARVAGHLNMGAVVEICERLPASRLRRLITDENPTRSDLERDFLAFVDRYDLPRPHINVFVAGYEIDFCYPEQRLIVEVDSWKFHKDRQAFEDDRLRDSVTTAAGYRTVRVTAERLTAEEAERLRAILGS